ncbi:CHAT domain-containing protein [Archangium gephyra]|uniref:CHAT domain-containing protein n=1 Tax=Archangium gephyra TaxID=48 RepID=A0AAC8QAC8_9BACT|nr:CHAT domain-containing protein [Archangium gephyra]AKJ03791.1 High-affnity carbon uptake protein Hat/HatR [Archangium gephyra]REG23572.1 CHAT domain-containing protein [Archangium gephyra]
MASELWLEIDINRVGEELSATARGGQNVQLPAHSLGARFSSERVRQFGEWVKRAAADTASLTRSHPEGKALREAQDLYQALFQPGLLEILHKLQGAAGSEPVLLRLNPQELELKAIPWEALCRPGSTLDFLGTSQEVLLVRGVESTRFLQPREVKGAVRLLVISPSDEDAPERLRAMLHPSIQAGELEWLEPLTGPRASKSFLQDRLRREPVPHILHFIGHGGLDDEGAPSLQLVSREEEPPGFKVELLAQELMAAFRTDLRLVVLESCEGAQPGELASAAELLARSGAAAVVAHLWPVKADVARHCSAAFYRSLTQAAAQRGDVARSLHDARRSILGQYEQSAEAFSPVLYLRGHESTLFDFKRRKVVPPSPPTQVKPAASTDPGVGALLELLQQPFSLLLGDHGSGTFEPLHKLLREQLQEAPWTAPEHLPLSALAQRYALQSGEDELRLRFQEAVNRDVLPSMPLVEELARWLRPGFHITLLRQPVLELALAAHRPDVPLYVIQPSKSKERPLIRQHVAGKGWVPLAEPPASFNAKRDVVLVRLYRGYMPDPVFAPPLLTEDDYLRNVRELESVLPQTLADTILSTLANQPALLLGMSLLSWDHRHLLQCLFNRALPGRSTVLLEPEDATGNAWYEGRGLPRGVGIQTAQVASSGLAGLLTELRPGLRPGESQ